jgi:hypothetical protein
MGRTTLPTPSDPRNPNTSEFGLWQQIADIAEEGSKTTVSKPREFQKHLTASSFLCAKQKPGIQASAEHYTKNINFLRLTIFLLLSRKTIRS